ncbi:Uncharacterised protein [Serratia marcescens]|nr:Uncharacterised protein [Serratia marcescens]
MTGSSSQQRAVEAVVTVDNFHTLFCYFNSQRRNKLPCNKRIPKLFNVRLV